MSLQIGNVKIDGNLALGPMAGVTDLPFRVLCKEQGADLIYTEMVSAKGIYYKNKNTDALLEIDESERPVALQLFGSDPEIMGSMAAQIEYRNFDILDINMGCPVPKVVNNGEGSAMLKTPKLAGEVVEAVAKSIKKPVSVKFRIGFEGIDENIVDFAKRMEASGAKLIAVHGRTRAQYYSGTADWDIIRQIKKAVSIPVLGNGDVFTPQDAKAMLEQTECDGIMIARGVRGNPWLFKEVKAYLEHGELIPKPSCEELVGMVLRHGRLQVKWKGENIGIKEMRKHVAWYTTGYKNSAKLRSKVNEINTYADLEKVMYTFLDMNQKTQTF
ncbi:tRNA dihydrouridine synthase DusB [[Clostridium] polysaccharolyticum]|uniref:tRNA-dihydrouridine synthase n=1 Tax=[Clostridium] polysaccharolyticum TaxID=29364 RepID=A0A1H9Z739_9FIRM|nr:tRNA dihydrouridine synthase DusB [[Clostridium] polysaccharolyticum]SES77155.1 tRNA-U20-dihydrouridine synthase [[Clostridium] polysaccharolyticum]